MTTHLKPKSHTAISGSPFATVTCTSQGHVADLPTLSGLVVSIDPRTILRCPRGYDVSCLALEAALAAFATLGVREVSAHWLAVRTGIQKSRLAAVLERLNRETGHMSAELVGTVVRLGEPKRLLLVHDLYAQIRIEALKSAPSATAARALLIASLASVSPNGARSIGMDDARRWLGLGPKQDVVAGFQATLSYVAEHLPKHSVTAAVGDDGQVLVRAVIQNEWRLTGSPIFDPTTQGRRFLGTRIKDYIWLDGAVAGHSMSVSDAHLCSQVHDFCSQEFRIASPFAAYRSLWLGALSAIERGVETGLPFWEAMRFGEELAASAEQDPDAPANWLFVLFALAAAEASDRGRSDQALAWTAPASDVEQERIDRRLFANGDERAQVVGRSVLGESITEAAWSVKAAKFLRQLEQDGVGGRGRRAAFKRMERLNGIGTSHIGSDKRQTSIRPATILTVERAPSRDVFPRISASAHADYAEDAVLAAVAIGYVESSHIAPLTRAVEAVCRAVATAGRKAFTEAVRGLTSQADTISRLARPLVRVTLGTDFAAIDALLTETAEEVIVRLVTDAWLRATEAKDDVVPMLARAI